MSYTEAHFSLYCADMIDGSRVYDFDDMKEAVFKQILPVCVLLIFLFAYCRPVLFWHQQHFSIMLPNEAARSLSITKMKYGHLFTGYLFGTDFKMIALAFKI